MYASSSLGRVDPARLGPYVALLIAVKCLRSLGLFLAYDILNVVHLVVFVFIIKAGSAAVLVPLQRPFSSGKRLSKRQWIRVLRHSFIGTLITLLWIFGLTLCGPVRSIVLYEHSEVVVSAVVAALFTNRGGGPSRTRGAFMFALAILGLLLFDSDLQPTNSDHPEGVHKSAITHIFYRAISWLGVSDHKGGVMLLVVLLFTNVAYKNTSKKLSLDVGGAKRLHALSTLLSTAMLCPWAIFHLYVHENRVESWLSLVIPISAIILVLFIVDYYVESVSVNRLEIFKTSRYSAYALFTSALLLSYLWYSPPQNGSIGEIGVARNMEHAVSGGVIFSTVLFIFATRILGYPLSKSSKGSLVGYTAAGLPLYNFTGDALHKTSQSIMMIGKSILKQILEASDSRQIFYYLCINLAFTFVELIYGVWTNSLGLISDGFHMLFDCTALVVGLTAAVMTHWKATRMFSYGFGRLEILSGFVNGLFLVVISGFVFMAAVGRILDPPEVSTDKLLTVSVAGLLVNLIGIFVFRNAGHAHSHGGTSSHGHSHGGHGHGHGGHGHGHSGHGHSGHGGHGHSHGGHSHGGHGHGGHSHSDGGQEEHAHSTQNTNMQGVFLHVLADTLGSVGVIISSLLIDQFGLLIADPICSMFIAIMIFISVMPLLRDTAVVLVQRIPVELEHCLSEGLNKVRLLDGVLGYRDQHFWRHCSDSVAGTLHVRVTSNASEQKIIQQVTSIFKEFGVTNFTVQIEKEEFFQHMSGLSATFDQMLEMTHQIQAIPSQDDLYDIKAV